MAKAQSLFSVEPSGSLADNAPLMLYMRLSEMLYFSVHINDPANVAELHSMRIAAKRLRYTLEIFTPAFSDQKTKYAALIGEVKSCQEQIGDIHDCDVRIDQIRDYLDQNVVKRPEIRIGLARLIEKETDLRRRLYEAFAFYWAGLAKDRSFERKFVEIAFASRIGAAKPAAASKAAKTRKGAAAQPQA